MPYLVFGVNIYGSGRELNFHWKCVIGYKGERNYAHQPFVTTLSLVLSLSPPPGNFYIDIQRQTYQTAGGGNCHGYAGAGPELQMTGALGDVEHSQIM